jgi:hypothetical protein
LHSVIAAGLHALLEEQADRKGRPIGTSSVTDTTSRP